MRQIPAEIQYQENRPVVIEFCPVCGEELTEYHDHPSWYDYDEYPGEHISICVPGAYVRHEVAQDPDGEWWYFGWIS